MSKLLINENPLMVSPTLAARLGLNEAIILQQIHYWVSKSTHFIEGRKWIFNTIRTGRSNSRSGLRVLSSGPFIP